MRNILRSLFKTDSVNFLQGRHSYDLVICDDIYPHPSSGFRLAEFTNLLHSIRNSKAILSGNTYTHFNLSLQLHRQHVRQFVKDHPELQRKIELLRGNVNINCRLFYCVFLNNIADYLPHLEEYKIPFAFTLYPGGGFNPGTTETDTALRRVFGSPQFRKVIVTQTRTYDYLVNNNFCSEIDIVFIFGVVVPQESIFKNRLSKKFYGFDKTQFDICFCAAKYTKYGEDKGYPIFVDFMKSIAKKYEFVRFHVIGGFDKDVLDVEEIASKIKFYGYQDFTSLKEIFQTVDLIISPNQPNKLTSGAFDGFPLGTVIEAAFNEVGVMLTDCLHENKYFENEKEVIIIDPDVEDMINKFDRLLADVSGFYEMAKRGKKKFKYIYSDEYQLAPRINLLKSLIEENQAVS